MLLPTMWNGGSGTGFNRVKIDMKKPTVHIIISVITGSFLFLSGCEPDRCFHSTGPDTQREIETGFFNKMNVYGIFNIILVEDSSCYVEFEGGEKMLEYVEAKTTDSILRLDNYNSCFFLRDYEKVKAYVHFRTLNKVNLFEVCKIVSYDSLTALRSLTMQAEIAEVDLLLNTENFSFYNNRTTGGIYTFSGYADNCWISGYYTAKFSLENLVSRYYYVNNSSLSDMYINATERLTVKILHDGNIYYSGSPEIVIDSLSGNGRLLPWEK